MTAPRTDLINAVTDQDIASLAASLLKNSDVVRGIRRHASLCSTVRITPLCQDPPIDGSSFVMRRGGMPDGSYLAHRGRPALCSRSPCAVAKCYAYRITVIYREATACMPATASCSPTKRRCAVSPLLHARSSTPQRVSRWACRIAATWETSTRCASGATPRTTSKCNG